MKSEKGEERFDRISTDNLGRERSSRESDDEQEEEKVKNVRIGALALPLDAPESDPFSAISFTHASLLSRTSPTNPSVESKRCNFSPSASVFMACAMMSTRDSFLAKSALSEVEAPLEDVNEVGRTLLKSVVVVPSKEITLMSNRFCNRVDSSKVEATSEEGLLTEMVTRATRASAPSDSVSSIVRAKGEARLAPVLNPANVVFDQGVVASCSIGLDPLDPRRVSKSRRTTNRAACAKVLAAGSATGAKSESKCF